MSGNKFSKERVSQEGEMLHALRASAAQSFLCVARFPGSVALLFCSELRIDGNAAREYSSKERVVVKW